MLGLEPSERRPNCRFPSKESYVRLLSCYLIEYTEDWEHEESCISKEALDQIRVRRE